MLYGTWYSQGGIRVDPQESIAKPLVSVANYTIVIWRWLEMQSEVMRNQSHCKQQMIVDHTEIIKGG